MEKPKKEIVWFGMKLSPEEKEKIKKLARVQGLSQKEAVMNLIESSLVEYEAAALENTLRDQVQKYGGIIDSDADLSVNKSNLEGYGSSSLS